MLIRRFNKMKITKLTKKKKFNLLSLIVLLTSLFLSLNKISCISLVEKTHDKVIFNSKIAKEINSSIELNTNLGDWVTKNLAKFDLNFEEKSKLLMFMSNKLHKKVLEISRNKKASNQINFKSSTTNLNSKAKFNTRRRENTLKKSFENEDLDISFSEILSKLLMNNKTNVNNNSTVSNSTSIFNTLITDNSTQTNALGYLLSSNTTYIYNPFDPMTSCDQVYMFNAQTIPDLNNVAVKSAVFITMSPYIINMFEFKNSSKVLLNSINLRHLSSGVEIIPGSNFCVKLKNSVRNNPMSICFDLLVQKILTEKNITTTNFTSTISSINTNITTNSNTTNNNSSSKANTFVNSSVYVKYQNHLKLAFEEFSNTLKTLFTCRLGDKPFLRTEEEVIEVGSVLAASCIGEKIYRIDVDTKEFKTQLISSLRDLNFNVKLKKNSIK